MYQATSICVRQLFKENLVKTAFTFEFWYRYDERKEITYQYYLNWYELNDMSLTQWDRVLPRIKE